MRTVMGVDLSLTSTGLIVLGESGEVLANKAITSKPSGLKLLGRMARYDAIADEICQAAMTYQPSVACIEHYVTGGAGGGIAERIELGCIVRRMLMDLKVEIHEVPPTTLKKWTTGKGAFKGGGKTPMVVAIMSRWGVEFSTDDEYDAYALGRMAHQIAGLSQPSVEFQREAIDVVLNGRPKKSRKKEKQ